MVLKRSEGDRPSQNPEEANNGHLPSHSELGTDDNSTVIHTPPESTILTSDQSEYPMAQVSNSSDDMLASEAPRSPHDVHEDAANIYHYITQQARRKSQESTLSAGESSSAAPGGVSSQFHYDAGAVLSSKTAELHLDDRPPERPPQQPRKATNPFRPIPQNPTPAIPSSLLPGQGQAANSQEGVVYDEPTADEVFGAAADPAVEPFNPWAEEESQTSGSQHTTEKAAGKTPVPQSTPLIQVESASGRIHPLEPTAARPVLTEASNPTSGAPAPPVEASSVASVSASRPSPSSPPSIPKQHNEIYQIRKVRWQNKPTPILVQNANGPCPLLALVNALVLTTPSGQNTALVETLSTREQVSLGLLLDAVFDELMSGRRGGIATQLPDVSELYSFLVTLHTGMNVNPRFTSKPDDASVLMDVGERPGNFESTREMRLYSAFAIPLIHGWLPEPTDPAYEAFDRSAGTFDEAQSFLFYEEELEAKLQESSLTTKEQTSFMDISVMKEFFAQWPTQLTEYGLTAMRSSMPAGSVAILFRNDHFSTLFKMPHTDTLMTLVTDAGYATHDEIVWESLVDIPGNESEMFSGDFRSVSHDQNGTPGVDNQEGWTTVQSRNRRSQQQPPPPQQPVAARGSTNASVPDEVFSGDEARARELAVQEDADMALAIQLQEEENEHQRRARAARQGVSNDGPAPPIPPRRSNTGPQQQGTTMRTSRPDDGSANAPPTYEQAAYAQPFHPPRGHPANEHAPRRQSTQENDQTASQQMRDRARRGFRQRTSTGTSPFDPPAGMPLSSEAVADRREGCVLM